MITLTEMCVKKRDGELEDVSFDKILNRIKKLGQEAGIQINYSSLAMKVIDQLYDKIDTTKIDELAAEECASLSTLHPDYGTLSSRIIVSNHQKNTDPLFLNVVTNLYNFINVHGENKPLVSKELWHFTQLHSEQIQNMIDDNRDYLIDYFGFKTLERAYLFKIHNKVVERIQHMWMRVSIGIHGDVNNPDSLQLVKETYDYMSQKYFTHATPTLFNAGTPRPQLSSCYLIAMEDDSIDGIYNTLKDCAHISKYSGGIGLHVHNIRAKDSHIQGTNGKTDGLVPMLRVFNSTARYVNQCFTPDSWVYSKNGPKQFKEINTTDKLVTIDGSFKKVNEIIVNDIDKEILEIRITNSMFPIKVTKEHHLYLIKEQKKLTNFLVIKNRLDKDIIHPNYYPASELNENDLVGFPIPTYEEENMINDLDFYKFYGMMLGDGHICKNNKESGITLGTNCKEELINFTKTYLNKLNIKFWEIQNYGCLSIRWASYNNDKLNISRELLYNDKDEKIIHSSFLHLPKNKILKIIEGLLKTDGSNKKELYFFSSSLNLIMQLRYLFLRLGILTSGNIKNHIGESHETIHGRIITTKKLAYTLRIPKHPNLSEIINYKEKGLFFKYFEWKGMLWGRIKSIKHINYSGQVYDFNMIDNHNYLTDMGLVHNSGKRNGSFAIYLEPWHPDVEDFLEMKKNHGDEELKARDLFYALWISDLFMERVKSNAKWSLFCPHECPGLSDVYGDDFVALYNKYEETGKVRKVVNARDLWFKILDAQMETGTPYILFKDSANKKSNQQNLGTIKSSNLCVAPETLVLTIHGHIPIQELENKEIEVWNGEEFSNVKIIKTGTDQELMKVICKSNKDSNVSSIECTYYHKFYIEVQERIIDDYNYHQIVTYVKQINAKDLKIGMRLIGCNMPDTSQSYDYMEIFGLENLGRISDTFCFTEPKKHMGVFNGILTGQCTEILEYSDDKETAVCNLASIALPTFVNSETRQFDYEKLHHVTKVVTNNLNRVIDINFYPTEKTKVSNLKHRPIGIGVQGLADTFVLMDIAFHSEEAKEVNKNIFETIYHASLEKSNEIAYERHQTVSKMNYNFVKINGIPDYLNDYEMKAFKPHCARTQRTLAENYRVGSYSSFNNSPASNGILQYDMWNITPSERYNWQSLKDSIVKYGLRNSLLLAPMPTASTSQILGFNECFEPFTSNLYSRRTLAGEFVVVNKYLMRELIELGLWNEKIKNNIIANQGSIQQLTMLSEHIRNKYKIVWEMPMKHLIDMSADRGAFICQSQSLNLWVEDPTYNTLTSMHFYSWKKGLKTGIYYLRRKPKHQAQQFTIEPERKENKIEEKDEICEMCSA